MKKIFPFILAFLISCTIGSGQIKVFTNKENNLYGLHNPKTKRIICKAEFLRIQKYKNYYVLQNTDNRFGVINKHGKLIIPFEYKEIKPGSVISNLIYFYGFHVDAFAHRLLNENGKIVMGDSLDDIYEILCGTKNNPNYIRYKSVHTNKFGLLKDKFKPVLPPIYKELQLSSLGNNDCFFIETNNKFQIINLKSEILFEDSVRFNLFKFNNGVAPIIYPNECRFVNEKMEPAFSFTCLTASVFVDGAALIKVKIHSEDGVKFNYKWGLINTKGEYLIEPIYDDIGFLSMNTISQKWYDGYAIVKVKIVNDKGTTEHRFGLIHSSGKTILKPIYKNIHFDFDNFDYIMANLDDKWGMYDKNGGKLLDHEYCNYRSLEEMKDKKLFPIYYDRPYRPEEIEQVFGYQTSEKIIGYYHLKKKKMVLDPRIYDYIAYEFENGFYWGVTDVEYDNRFGLINKKGKTRVPVKYKYEELFFEDTDDYTRWKQFWKVIPKIVKHWFVK